ncbi:2-C-methyl-D-erythritol 4-phosphate cytidylyltransferase [Elusimicrobiota bacterium]
MSAPNPVKDIDVLLMAAGTGERFGKRKQFVDLAGQRVIKYSIDLLSGFNEISRIIVVFPLDMDEREVKKLVPVHGTVFIRGEKERSNSVINGLKEVTAPFVLIHDAVRPCCSEGTIRRVIDKMRKSGAAIPAVNPVSTVKELDETGRYMTIDRENICLVQTPQGFKTEEIMRAYKDKCVGSFTDSSSIAEEAGIYAEVVNGNRNNLKITYEDDWRYLEFIIENKRKNS